MSNIINFKQKAKQIALRRLALQSDCGVLAVQEEDTISEFELSKNILLKGYKTRSTKFMFPTTLAPYRKGMNPVAALYAELQETIFLFDEDNITHAWLLNLFADKEWVNALLDAINDDYDELMHFHAKYESRCHFKELIPVIHTMSNYKQYHEVFAMANALRLRYVK